MNPESKNYFFWSQSKFRVLLFLIGILVLAFIVQKAKGKGDFFVFLEAGKLIAAHENIYTKWILVSGETYCLYFYSPLFALLLLPFTNLPTFIPNFIWLLLNVYFLFRISKILAEYFELNEFDSKSKILLFVLIIAFTIRFVLYNFDLIQMTLYLIWSILESIRLIKKDKNLLGGSILATAINIKILPIVILPYLLYRKHLKAFFITLAILLLLLFLPAVYLGFSYNNFLLVEWWKTLNPFNSEHLVEAGLGMHSLSALIPSLMQETTGELELKRNLFSLNENMVIIILNATRGLLILSTLYYLKTFPLYASKSKLHELWELGYILLLIPLIFPHQQKYAFAFILPAVAYIFYYLFYLFKFHSGEFRRTKWKIVLGLLILAFILMTLSTDGIIGRPINKITQHYKTITYGAILLLLILAICNPRLINQHRNQSTKISI